MGRENEILVTPEILRQTAQNLKDLFQKGLKGYEEICFCVDYVSSCSTGLRDEV